MSSDETLAAVLESNSSQNSAIVDTPETSANEIDAPPDLVTCEDHAAVENVMEGLGLGDGDHHAGAGGIDSCAMDALAALSFASGQLFCCRVYQESGGFYHDYSCVQSTLNLETRLVLFFVYKKSEKTYVAIRLFSRCSLAPDNSQMSPNF